MEADVLGFALTIAGLCILCFYMGATVTWAWAKGSLDVPAPPWIPGIALIAGGLFVAPSVLTGDWVGALATAPLWLMLSGHQFWFWWRSQRSAGGTS